VTESPRRVATPWASRNPGLKKKKGLPLSFSAFTPGLSLIGTAVCFPQDEQVGWLDEGQTRRAGGPLESKPTWSNALRVFGHVGFFHAVPDDQRAGTLILT
jgi:hypothetical protein